MGTSLTVQPFASLPQLCPEGTPRLLINLDRVGGLGSRPNDVVFLGHCDTGVRRLVGAIGWTDELERIRRHVGGDQYAALISPDDQDNELEKQVSMLAKDIDSSLKVSRAHSGDLLKLLARSSGSTEELQSQL